MNYWLIKSEGTCYSIDDLKRDKKTSWEGIRNYQARNFMMKAPAADSDAVYKVAMKKGDLALFYHSMGDPTGVYGVAKVASQTHVDESQFNKKGEHFDPKATRDKPFWFCVDFSFVKKFSRPVSLDEIKNNKNLSGILVAKKGSRLSIQPVSENHFNLILKLRK